MKSTNSSGIRFLSLVQVQVDRSTLDDMVSFIKSVTFDCHEPLLVAAFWAEVLGSNVGEDSTPDRAWVEPAGWGGPSLWFVRVPEQKTAKTASTSTCGPRQHTRKKWVGWSASAPASCAKSVS
jgi:hypothetical protein